MSAGRTPHPAELAAAGHPRDLANWFEQHRAAGHDVIVDPSTGVTWFLSVDDAEALLTAPEVGAGVAMAILAVSGVVDGPLHDLWSNLMFGKDGDEHRRIRGTVARRLTHRALEHRAAEVGRISSDLLDSWEPGTTVDAWSSYALPLSAQWACRTVGIPTDGADEVARWSLALSQAFGAMDPGQVAEAQEAAAGLVDHLGRLIESDDLAPDGVWSDLVRRGDHPLSADELVALGANLLFGGLDATAKAITTGLAHLLDDATAWAALVADPTGVAAAAVAETLRMAPPAAGVIRLANAPTSCHGVDIAAYGLVAVSLDALCRDPAASDRPERLDLDRPAGRQFAFGAGPHHCVGAAAARLAIAVAFTDVASRFPQARLAEPADALTWEANPFRGITRLPIVLDGRTPDGQRARKPPSADG